MSDSVLVLPHQLFKHNPAFSPTRSIVIAELDYFFNRYRFHKQKLWLHYASLAYYHDYLVNAGYTVSYLTWQDAPTLGAVCTAMASKGVQTIHYVDLIEQQLCESLLKALEANNLSSIEYETPYMVTRQMDIEAFFKRPIHHFVFEHFYRAQRQRLGILVQEDGKPVGGHWNYDAENRHKLPPDIVIPEPFSAPETVYATMAYEKVEKLYPNNPGQINTRLYPVTHAGAEALLEDFLQKRLAYFGPYEDALSPTSTVVFHSMLSAILNNGLLTPGYTLERTMKYATANKHVPLASLEGFVRQLIGWREFVYGMYIIHGKRQQRGNFFRGKRSLAPCWWTAETGINPIDISIQRVLEGAYVHHIERLMVIGNSMLLCEVKPKEVYDWFMTMFIDAYDWVMVPNVYGMSQYADGGLMVTKPYISGSSYIKSMSSYGDGPWATIWDSLFWNFMHKHQQAFKRNARIGQLVATMHRMKPALLLRHRYMARDVIKRLTKP